MDVSLEFPLNKSKCTNYKLSKLNARVRSSTLGTNRSNTKEQIIEQRIPTTALIFRKVDQTALDLRCSGNVKS